MSLSLPETHLSDLQLAAASPDAPWQAKWALACRYSVLNDVSQALTWFDAAITALPMPEWHSQAGALLVAQASIARLDAAPHAQKYAVAQAVLRDLDSADSSAVYTPLARGAALEASGDARAALAEYATASTDTPHAASLHTKLGNLHKLVTGDIPAAKAAYQRALAAAPGNAEAMGALAVLLHAALPSADASEAAVQAVERAYQDALAACPDHCSNLSNYALFLADVQGAASEAQLLYQRALSIDPAHSNALYNYGVLCDNVLEDALTAQALYRRAIIAAPRHALAHFNLGVSLHTAGTADEADLEAAQLVGTAVELAPRDVDMLCEYAALLADLRASAAAKAVWARCLRQAAINAGLREPSAAWWVAGSAGRAEPDCLPAAAATAGPGGSAWTPAWANSPTAQAGQQQVSQDVEVLLKAGHPGARELVQRWRTCIGSV